MRGWTAEVFSSQASANDNTPPEASARPKGMPEVVNTMSDAMARAMSSLPKIQEASKLFSTLSKQEREKLSIALGIEYTQGMSQLTVQEIEAVTKLREIGLRFSLYL